MTNKESFNNNLAIVDAPLVVEEPMWSGDSEYPNSVLHDIVTRKIDGVEEIGVC